MRRITMTLALMMCWASAAHAGTVDFNPPLHVVDPLVDTTIAFEVSIPSFETITTVNQLDLLIGSDDIAIISFEFAESFCGSEFVACDALTPAEPSVYPNEIELFAYIQADLGAPVVLGTLTLDVRGIMPGVHGILVDPVLDLGQSRAWNINQGVEPLAGSAVVVAIPEPGTLLLVGLSAAALRICRGKRPSP